MKIALSLDPELWQSFRAQHPDAAAALDWIIKPSHHHCFSCGHIWPRTVRTTHPKRCPNPACPHPTGWHIPPEERRGKDWKRRLNPRVGSRGKRTLNEKGPSC